VSELQLTAQTINEDAYGANGDLDRRGRVHNASTALVDYVFECLLDHGIRFQDPNIYRAIEFMIARAMIAQFEYDEEMQAELLKGFVSLDVARA
jgi:hypothetical protein